MKVPKKRIVRTSYDQEWNDLVDLVVSLMPKPSNNTLTEHSPHGVFRKAKPGQGGGGTVRGSTLPVWQ